jgi:hypothetical protein
LLSNSFFDSSLCLDIEGISIECLYFSLLSQICFELSISRLSEQFSKTSGIRLGRCCYLGLCLGLRRRGLFSIRV